MNMIQKYLVKFSAVIAFTGLIGFVNPSEVSANFSVTNWVARTVSQISEEIIDQTAEQDSDEKNFSVQLREDWVDTQGIDHSLLKMNDIDNSNLINGDSEIYLSKKGSRLSERHINGVDSIEEVDSQEEILAEVDELAVTSSTEEETTEVEETVEVEEPTTEPEPEVAETEEVTETQEVTQESQQQSGYQLIGDFQATAYAVGDGLTPNTYTRNGTDVANTIYTPSGNRIIAVDTNVIPLNSTVFVELPNGESFYATAADTGSAIKGHIIDLLMPSPSEALQFGRQNGIKIYWVN